MGEKLQDAVWAEQDQPSSSVTLAIKPQARKPYDPGVTFEEYSHYAKLTRAEQITLESPKLNVLALLGGSKTADSKEEPELKLTAKDFTRRENRLNISDEEWANASRAMRTASAGACE